MRKTLIRTDRLCKSHKMGAAAVQSLRDIYIEITEGEFVSVMGPSGSGKTTLVNILGLLDRPSSGSYFLDGMDTTALSRDQMAFVRNRRIGFVFQNFNLLARHTALENVELPLVYSGLGQTERLQRASSALEAVGLGGRLDHRPHQLSGGEQQRVAIARALVINPALILADEPTGALDSRTGLELIHQLQSLNSAGRTIVMVTHDRNLAGFARRKVELADGRISSDSPRPPFGVE